MNKYKTMFFGLLLIISSVSAFAQSPKFWITNVDNSNFPTIRLNYVALDVSNRKIAAEDLTKEDFRITENNGLSEIENFELNCGFLENDIPLSVVLALDVTESLTNNDNNINYLEWIQEASRIFIDSLDFENGSEANIVKWAGSAEALGWSENEGQLLSQIDDILIKPGRTDFNQAFLNLNGAIEQLKSAKENTRKVILFFTDGEHTFQGDPDSFEWEEIRDLCIQNGIEVFCVETNAASSNWRLGQLASQTGGEAYFINQRDLLSSLFEDFFFELSDSSVERCFIEYETSVPCLGDQAERDVKVEFSKFTPPFPLIESTKRYEIPTDGSKFVSLSQERFYMSGNGETELELILTAKNGDFSISGFNVIPDDGNISISETNFDIINNETKSINIILDPSIDVATTNYELTLISDQCEVPPIEIITPCEAVASEETIELGNVPSGLQGSNFVSIRNQLDETINGRLSIENNAEGAISLVSPADLELGPLEEKQVEFSYLINDDVDFLGELVFEFNSNCGPTVVEINGTGVSGAVTLSNHNFGDVRQMVRSDATLELTNSGESQITVESISFQDNSILSFGFADNLQDQLPTSIEAGGNFTFDVSFIPVAEGNFLQGIVIDRADGNQDIFPNALVGNGTLPRIEANDLTFATQTNAQSEIQKIIIENKNSTEELIVGEIRFATGENAEGNFTILTDVENQAIPIGGEFEVDVEFLPVSAGVKTATIEIVHNAEIGDVSVDEIYSVQVSGEYDPEEVPGQITIQTLNFGERLSCNTHQENIRVNNPNDFPINVKFEIDDPNGVFSLLADVVYVLEANKETSIPILFEPNEAGIYNASIRIQENNVIIASADLNGISIVNSLPINIINNDIDIEVNSSFDLEFELDLSNQNYTNNDFTFYVEYNSNQLFLNENTDLIINNGDLTGNIVINDFDGEIRRATINTSVNDVDRINISLSMLALLHNIDVTKIEVSAEDKDCFNIIRDEISVTVDGCVNEFSGVATDGNYAIEKIYPNPVSSDFNIDYSIAIEAQTEINIINTNGNIAKEVFSGNLQAGNYSVYIPINELENGIYFIKIKSLHWSKTEKIVIAK